jgi:hypothetical protein
MPPLVFDQTQRFFSSSCRFSPARRSSPMCLQSMHTKAMAPSRQAKAAWPTVSVRNAVKASEDISPAPIANSRWRTRPRPQT